MNNNLAHFRRIGRDFDDTLIGHHSSPLFWDYIRQNPNRQEHYIVTFRTSYLIDSLWHDLTKERSGLGRHHFRGLFGVPEALFADFSVGDNLDRSAEYLEWKGMQCFAAGIDVLVDDATEQVVNGCSRFGVAHLHPDQAKVA